MYRLIHTTILMATLASMGGRLKPGQLPPCTGQGDGQFVYYSVVKSGVPTTQCAVLGDGMYIDTNTSPARFFITMASLEYTYGEIPVGVTDGANKTFTVLHPPIGSSLLLYVNGQPIPPAGFTVSLQTITLATAPPAGSIMMAVYRYT